MTKADNKKSSGSEAEQSPPKKTTKENKPVPFFATIHHDHYEPGEVERINRRLLEQYEREQQEENLDSRKD